MVCLLGVLCAVLALFNFILWIKIVGYRKAADEICEEMEARLGRDTNVGIDISISDHKMRRLAAEIDRQMKLLRKEQIRYLQGDKELKEAVTNISHDLRTPLTALLLYTELLSQGKYKDEKEMEQYLKKTAHKANQIKQMSDDLFERFYITKNEDIMLEVPEKLCYIFENRLSDLVMFLHSQGFRVECDTDWPEVKLSVLPEYMDRILDNIASNLLKYADKTEPVTIVFSMQDQPEKQITMIIRNKIDQNPEDVSSTCVGVANIEQMMHKMKGICKVENDGQFYEISLVFPAYE